MHMTPLILFQFVHQVFKQTPPPRTEPTPKTRTVVLVFWVRVRVGLNGGCLRRGGGFLFGGSVRDSVHQQ